MSKNKMSVFGVDYLLFPHNDRPGFRAMPVDGPGFDAVLKSRVRDGVGLSHWLLQAAVARRYVMTAQQVRSTGRVMLEQMGLAR